MTTNKIKCILLDDEMPGLTYLRMLCEQIPALEVVKAFNDPQKLVNESKDLDFDICILDIEMPGLNGIDVARSLNNKPVIFTTAYKEFAAEAFDLDAIDYIRKPIQKERLELSVLKAQKRLALATPAKSFIQANTNKGKSVLFFDQVAHISTAENDKRDKIAYLKDGTELHLKNISFDQLLESLPKSMFCRINKKDIVSLESVRHFTHQEITLFIKTEQKLALNEVYKDNFLKHMPKH